MRSLSKRLLPAAVAVALVGLSGCGGDDEPAKTADGRTVLKVSVWDYATTPEFKALFDAFEAKNPDIDIQQVDIPAGNDYAEKLTTMLAGGDKTDVLTMKNTTDYARYGTRGQLVDLTGMVDGLKDKDKYAGLKDYDLQGKYYALPYRQDFWVLYYNKKLVGKEDLSGLTWDSFSDLAKRLTKGSGSSKSYGAYFHTWRSVIEAVASAQTGGDFLSGKYDWMKDQYTMVLDLQKAGAVMPFATANSQKADYDGQFTTEKAAMLPMGTWFGARLIDEKNQGKNPTDWAIAPMPQIKADGQTSTFGSPTGFAVNKKARNAEAAKKFVEWATGPEGAQAIAKIGIVPAYSDASVLDTFFKVPGMPNDELSRKAMQPGKVQLEMPISDRSSDIDQILNEEHEVIMSGEKSVDDGIKEMQDRVKNEVQ